MTNERFSSLPQDRRGFLRTSIAGCGTLLSALPAIAIAAEEQPPKKSSLAGVIGVTTGSLNYQREHEILTALTLPRFVRDELGMKLIDLNTRWLKSLDEGYIQRVRQATEDADCFVSNLKVNHQFGDLYSRDSGEGRRAMVSAQQLVVTAKRLGARWIRFSFPPFRAGDPPEKLVAHQELAQFAASHCVQMLVENGGWMKNDPDSTMRIVSAIGENIAPGPDTGNWDEHVRFEALQKAFPTAVTCDFKVFELDSDRRHTKYDIRRCFDIGWEAGFRGPWAIEHWNEDTRAFARETVFLRDQLAQWMANAG